MICYGIVNEDKNFFPNGPGLRVLFLYLSDFFGAQFPSYVHLIENYYV